MNVRSGVIGAGLVAAALASGGVAIEARPAQQPATSPRLELIAQDLAVEPDGTFRLDYRLTGISADELELIPPPPVEVPTPTLPDGTPDPSVEAPPPPPPPPPPLQLTIEITNYQPLESPRDVDDVVGSDVDPDAFRSVVDGLAISDLRDRATLADDGSIRFTLEVGTDVVNSVEERLKLERPGIHPLRVQLLVGDPADDNVIATAGTVVQRLAGADDSEAPPVDLSVVTVVPATRPDADDAEVDAARDAFEAAVDLAAALNAPVTIEVPPPLVADAAATPQGAAALADALTDDELVALPLFPLDVSSAVAAGRADVFTGLVNAGEDVLTSAVPTTPSLRTVWITADALSASGAQHLRDLGVRFVIVPAELYRATVEPSLPRTDLFVDAELPDGGTLPVMVVGDIADELDPRAADEILATATATEWSVATAARILVERDRDDQFRAGAPVRRSVVLTTPDLSAPDGRLLGALEVMAATTPSLQFVRASSLIGVTDTQRVGSGTGTVELPETAGPSLVERVALLDSTALELASVASMLPPDDPRPAEWTNELDQLISTGYSDAEVEAATDRLMGEADLVRQAVELPDPFTFTLTGRSGTIEVRLRNTSPDPLTVGLRFESPKVVFPDGDQVVNLRPNDQTSVVVPVEARSNGTSAITLTVSTPAGEPLGEPVTLTSRVTGFTGLGQLLTGGLLLVLLTWWFNHWRAKRRAVIDDGRSRHPASREVGSEPL
ncbi:MAG TPA: DUF6049 family protein [Ilumatobacteraceae bacterium]|nr:DUF6049 family protein [Ilumatobacteraceae bacterium]